jgi:hypothetical protein
MPKPTPRQPARPAPQPARALEDLLTDLVRAHEAFVHASDQHRDAIRHADTTAIARSRELVTDACVRIATLDAERRQVAEAMAPGAPDATISELAARLPEPGRSRALEMASTLRELVIKARTDQRRLRAAADSMLRHVRGVVQQVQQSLNHAGTYGRAGRVDAGARVVSGIDMTS